MTLFISEHYASEVLRSARRPSVERLERQVREARDISTPPRPSWRSAPDPARLDGARRPARVAAMFRRFALP